MHRGVAVAALAALALLLVVPATMGGFWDWFDSITGLATSDGTNLTIDVGNTVPVIISIVFNGSTITIPEDSAVEVMFFVWVNDSDGVGNLDGGGANLAANISLVGAGGYDIGSTPRINSSCTRLSQDFGGTERNYTCTIEMHYFDPPGDWNFTAEITDINGGSNSSFAAVTVDLTQGILLSPANITWPQLGALTTNQTPNNNITVNNTGNWNVTSFNVTAFDLEGIGAVAGNRIPAENFTISTNFTNACDFGYGMTNRSGLNGTATSVTNNSLLLRGNHSQGPGNGQKDLFLCLIEVPSLPAGRYASYDTWNVLGIE